MFKIIACINQKGILGKEGKLLYNISNDMNNFASMTKYNGVVIMGRKTFESLPNSEPLKDRVNIILTSNKNFGVDTKYDNVFIVHSIQDVVELCEAYFSDKELFVVGGGAIYHQFIEQGLVDEIRLTVVQDESEGDTIFPRYNKYEWVTYFKSCPQLYFHEGKHISFYYHTLKKKK